MWVYTDKIGLFKCASCEKYFESYNSDYDLFICTDCQNPICDSCFKKRCDIQEDWCTKCWK